MVTIYIPHSSLYRPKLFPQYICIGGGPINIYTKCAVEYGIRLFLKTLEIRQRYKDFNLHILRVRLHNYYKVNKV